MKEKLIDLFLENKGFIHQNLELKKNNLKGFYFVTNEEIKKDTILINVPKELLIPVDKIKSLKKFNNNFEEVYFDLILKNSQYLDGHPLNCKITEYNEIKNALKNNENLSRHFKMLYEEFNLLNNEEKIIKLFELTRSSFSDKFQKKFFMPVMDFVNHDEHGTNFMTGDNSNIYIKSNKVLKKNDEILVNYTHTDPITFYLKQGFINDDFNSFIIKKNELTFSTNKDMKVDERYFLKIGDKIKFKEHIDFKKNRISKNITNLMKIFPSDRKLINMINVLNYYKSTVKYDEKMLHRNKDSIIIKNFCKSVKLYHTVIDHYSKIISNLPNKHEKN